jgi:predicted RNA methylase
MSQTTGLKRNTIDKYYTKKSVVDKCLTHIKNNVEINSGDLIIEPSAGNGAFIDGIKAIGCKYRFYDLIPQNEEIEKQDYLLFGCYRFYDGRYKNFHVIGNPPFGRQASMAIKFIQKSCEFADSVSFILPKSFKKDSLQKKIPLNYHLIFQEDLPNNSFEVDRKDYDVPCVFQIWVRKAFDRPVAEKIEPIGFTFVKKNENPDISVRRIGVNAGTVDINIEKSIESHYFIKLQNNDESIINTLKQIKFTHNNTVGPKSISKQELIVKYNLAL